MRLHILRGDRSGGYASITLALQQIGARAEYFCENLPLAKQAEPR
jgi:hypothetical protein